MSLPEPSADARHASERLLSLIHDEIAAAGGWVSFARYMELALYAPELGYYTGGAHKFGAEGDFVTAPELTPLFGACLATQIAQWLAQGLDEVLEAGAGSGALAADLLLALDRLGHVPARYRILELSGELRARQQATLAERAPHLAARVEWLDTLPQTIDGVVVANELLDALPVHLVRWGAPILERGVACDAEGALVWQERPASDAVLAAAQDVAAAPGTLSELGLAARAWVASLADRLRRGALLLIDYGFPRGEYYLPQRAEGTLMCHYRHHAHADPLWWPGLNDITAHVDFTAIADAGFEAGLEVLGYTSQAAFLMNCGLLRQLEALNEPGSTAYLRAASLANRLINPAEMGELFKVMALGRGIAGVPLGFARGDRVHTL